MIWWRIWSLWNSDIGIIVETGARQEADIKFNDINSLEMPSEEKDRQKIRTEVICFAVSFLRIYIFMQP